MRKNNQSRHKASQGYVLVTMLVLLILLTLLGVWATKTSIFENAIASNERLHQEAFYQADGGTQLAERLVYANRICVYDTKGKEDAGFANETFARAIRVADKTFALKEDNDNGEVSDTNFAIQYFPGGTVDLTAPHTNILTTYERIPPTGVDMKAHVNVGQITFVYHINTQHVVPGTGSESVISTQWRLHGSAIENAMASCKAQAPYAY